MLLPPCGPGGKSDGTEVGEYDPGPQMEHAGHSFAQFAWEDATKEAGFAPGPPWTNKPLREFCSWSASAANFFRQLCETFSA